MDRNQRPQPALWCIICGGKEPWGCNRERDNSRGSPRKWVHEDAIVSPESVKAIGVPCRFKTCKQPKGMHCRFGRPGGTGAVRAPHGVRLRDWQKAQAAFSNGAERKVP